jgi:hypothetical protein
LPLSQGTGLETITGWDDRGFPSTRTVVSGWETVSKSYDQQGFLITGSPTTTSGGGATSLGAGINGDIGGKVVGTSTSKAGAAKESPVWRGFMAMGVAAVVVERLLQ